MGPGPMSPWSRLVAALALGWLFAWALSPRPAPRDENQPTVQDLLLASRDAFAAEEWQAALAPTTALVARFPTQVVYLERLARIYEKLDKPTEAAATWEQFVKNSATPWDACPSIGLAYRRAGNEEASIAAFERCRDLDSLSGEAWFFLGQAYRRAGRQAEAMATLRQALDLDPLHADSRVGLAGALLGAASATEALAVITPAVESEPSNPDTHLLLGLVLAQLGRRAEARATLTLAETLSPTYTDVQIALAILDYGDGHVAEAGDRFARAVALSPRRQAELQTWLDRTARGTP